MTYIDARTTGSGVVVRKRYTLCPSCGNFAAFIDKQAFCMICGTRMVEECSLCHEPIIYPVARFCPACGTKLVKSDQTK